MVYRSSRAPGSRSSFGQNESGGLRPTNVFRNDGSFLEMFKRMQDQQTAAAPSDADDGGGGSPGPSRSAPSPSEEADDPGPRSPPTNPHKSAPKPPPFVGKRRGGRVLPTGKVKRLKTESDTPEEIPKDAWSAYLAEVKRYKETTCEEDGKTRPLVK